MMGPAPPFDYRPRPVRFHDLWVLGSLRFKVYTIQYERAQPVVRLLPSAREAVGRLLRTHPTRQEHYGVGFACVHAGRGENQIIVDQWVNQNELLHAVLVALPGSPNRWAAPPADHNSVCTWELYLQAFERDAWFECVLMNPGGPDFDAYLERRLAIVV